MPTDTVIAEIRQYRDAIAERFNFDLRAIVQDAMERQAASGRKLVRFAPRPADKGNGQPPKLRPTETAGD